MTVALIMASGESTRMGKNKLLLPLNQTTVIESVVDFFLRQSTIDRVLVVSSSEEVTNRLRNRVEVIPGGRERQDSVRIGLRILKPDDYVLIHDGARPFLSQAAFDRCIEQVHLRQAFFLAVPVTDTLKQVVDGVITTPNRSEFYAAQTPQGAVVSDLMEAYESVFNQGLRITDDASALELTGKPVVLVVGDYANRKLTTPEDMRYL